MEPLVTTVNKAAKVIEAKRVVFEIFMTLSSWDSDVRPVEENVVKLESNCMADATNCTTGRFPGQLLRRTVARVTDKSDFRGRPRLRCTRRGRLLGLWYSQFVFANLACNEMAHVNQLRNRCTDRTLG